MWVCGWVWRGGRLGGYLVWCDGKVVMEGKAEAGLALQEIAFSILPLYFIGIEP